MLTLFAVINLVISSGCRCPWRCSNNELAESSRWVQEGLQASHENKHIHAETLLTKAAETRPSDPIIREHLAESYLQQGKTTEAIAELMAASEISPGDASILVKIGNLYLAGGQQLPAQQYAKKALAADRRSPGAWVLNAETKIAKGNLTAALSDYQRALSLKNDSPEIQLKIAEVQRLLGRPLRALSTVEQILASTPVASQPEEALLLSGRLLMHLQQPGQAVEKLKLAASRPDSTADSHYQFANALLATGQIESARNTLKVAQQRFPNTKQFTEKLTEIASTKERIASTVDMQTNEYVR